MTEHTPTPWFAYTQGDGTGSGLSRPDVCICTLKSVSNYDSPVDKPIAWTPKSYYEYGCDKYKADIKQNEVNARFIVKAVNAHEAMLALLDKCEPYVPIELQDEIRKLRKEAK